MPFPIRRAPAGAALIFTALFTAVSTVPAQAPGKPAPTCAGLATEDPAGDVAGGGGDNYDVKGLFFTYDGVRVQGHIQLADAGKTVSKPGLNARWILFWRSGDVFYYVRQWTNGTDTDYRYGTYDPLGDRFTGVADVKGSMVEGPDGVISLEIPKAGGGKAGGKITEAYVRVNETAETGAPANQVAYGPAADRAPDTGSAKEYTVTPCAGSGGTTTPPTTTPPSTQPGPPAAPARLGIKAPKSGGSARKASKRKKLTVKLTASQTITALTADLIKGSKVVGTGKLAKLEGKGTVTLKLKGKLAKGTYGLRLTGTVPDGRQAQEIAKLKLAR